jgi:hypothetical protein
MKSISIKLCEKIILRILFIFTLSMSLPCICFHGHLIRLIRYAVLCTLFTLQYQFFINWALEWKTYIRLGI